MSRWILCHCRCGASMPEDVRNGSLDDIRQWLTAHSGCCGKHVGPCPSSDHREPFSYPPEAKLCGNENAEMVISSHEQE